VEHFVFFGNQIAFGERQRFPIEFAPGTAVGECVVGSDACHGLHAPNRDFTRLYGLGEPLLAEFANFVWQFNPYRTPRSAMDLPGMRCPMYAKGRSRRSACGAPPRRTALQASNE